MESNSKYEIYLFLKYANLKVKYNISEILPFIRNSLPPQHHTRQGHNKDRKQ